MTTQEELTLDPQPVMGAEPAEGTVENVASTDASVQGSHLANGAGWLYTLGVLAFANVVLEWLAIDIAMIIAPTAALVAPWVLGVGIGSAAAIIIAGVYLGLGFLASKGRSWAAITGIVLYALDLLVAVLGFFVIGDDSMLLDVVVHVVVLFFLIKSVVQHRMGVPVEVE